MQFAGKLRRDNYAVLIIQMTFFPPLSLRQDKTAAILVQRKKQTSAALTHAHDATSCAFRLIDRSADRWILRTRETIFTSAPRHRRALTIGLAIINYVALKENELLWVAITMLNAAARLSMMLQNKYHLSKRSFIGD